MPATLPPSRAPARSGFGVALVLSGLCFVAYPALRPFSDEKSLAGAHAFASGEWTMAHSLGIFAFILLGVGLLGAYEALSVALDRSGAWAMTRPTTPAAQPDLQAVGTES